MTKMTKMTKTMKIFTILFCLTNLQSFACYCIGHRTVKEEIKHSNLVITGTIINKENIVLIDSINLKMFPNYPEISKKTITRYDFVVDEIYKGKITKDTIQIYTGTGNGDCGITFEMYQKYIVYGENETYFGQINNNFIFPKGVNILWTYICLRTDIYTEEEILEINKFAKKKAAHYRR